MAGFDERNTGARMIDRVTLEIEGAKLNVAVRNALKRKRGHDRSASSGPGRSNDGSCLKNGAGNQDPGGGGSSKDGKGQGAPRSGQQYLQQRGRQGLSSAEKVGACGRDGGSAEEVALLKGTIGSLRKGLRENEDAVTEAEREKEALLEQVARLDSTTEENIQLAQKGAALQCQIEQLEGKLTQAEAERALTMTLVDTLKSAQNDLRASHGQVSQRYTELENMAEDSAEAVRRGNVLLHSQQLKIDAQSRQIKRQEEDLVSLREERELHLTKADQNASELAHVLRRERAGQGSIADAQAEVEELKRELGHMRDAFARHRCAMRKNQEVIDAHEKALKETRSDLVSLSLEAEKQSARHHRAFVDSAAEMARITADRNKAVRESGALRIEKEDLKDKLEEAARKLDEVRCNAGSAVAAAAAEAGARSSAKLRRGHQKRTPHEHRLSHERNSVGASPFAPPVRQQRPVACSNQSDRSLSATTAASNEQLRGIKPLPQQQQQQQQQQLMDSEGIRSEGDTSSVADSDRHHNATTTLLGPDQESPAAAAAAAAPTTGAPASKKKEGLLVLSTTRPESGGVLVQKGAESKHEEGGDLPLSSGSNTLGSKSEPATFPSNAPGLVGEGVSSTLTDASAADAGAGEGGGHKGGSASGSSARGARPVIGPPNNHQYVSVASGAAGPMGCESACAVNQLLRDVPRGKVDGDRIDGGGAGSGDGVEARSSGRSRSRSPAAVMKGSELFPQSIGDGSNIGPRASTTTKSSSPFSDGVEIRKRERFMAVARGCDAAATGMGGGSAGVVGRASPSTHPSSTSSREGGKRVRVAQGIGLDAVKAPPPLLEGEEDGGNPAVDEGGDAIPDDGLCPSCGDTPYGLMINCSRCSRQHHSSCVPEEQKARSRGLAAFFLCSRCSK